MRLLTLVLLAGCASMNVFKYEGREAEPFMVERATTTEFFSISASTSSSVWSWDGTINKQLTFNNPLNLAVVFHVYCDYIMQGDLDVEVPPHSSKFATVSSTYRYKYDETCQMRWDLR